MFNMARAFDLALRPPHERYYCLFEEIVLKKFYNNKVIYNNSISMNTSSGVLILINLFKKRSFGSTSIKRLCILISHLSHVRVPCPQGVFLVDTTSFFVGNGTGPFNLTAVLSAIFFISSQIEITCWGSLLESLILAFPGI
jgi:hypothetical protein